MNRHRQPLECLWIERDAVPVQTRVVAVTKPRGRLMIDGRRRLQFGQLAEPVALEDFIRGQVVRAKGETATDGPIAVPPGGISWHPTRQRKQPTRVTPPLETSSYSSANKDTPASAVPEAVENRSVEERRHSNPPLLQPSDAGEELIAISISRMSTRTTTSLYQPLCPGGQAPDRLREQPTGGAKLSVSSLRPKESSAPRNRPRHSD
jgi:hypothetical protein